MIHQKLMTKIDRSSKEYLTLKRQRNLAAKSLKNFKPQTILSDKTKKKIRNRIREEEIEEELKDYE